MLLSIAGAIGGLAAAGAAFFGFMHHDGPPPPMHDASSTPPAGWMASSTMGMRGDMHFPPAPRDGDMRGAMGSSTDGMMMDGSSSMRMHPPKPMMPPPPRMKDGSTTPEHGPWMASGTPPMMHGDADMHMGSDTDMMASSSVPRPIVRRIFQRFFHLFGSK